MAENQKQSSDWARKQTKTSREKAELMYKPASVVSA